ncbi:hypothetical protein J2S05_002492 [Alkalicoccobacillus murimartini]|uniref:Uncharacterized protein n=1 Tax=Alkalicoccobacillus murimartini TaxID=171685 RepID=A0ABT9YJI9_9BACI|nr:hypothetical protein [Alkalicoccobacillus murimartini]
MDFVGLSRRMTSEPRWIEDCQGLELDSKSDVIEIKTDGISPRGGVR